MPNAAKLGELLRAQREKKGITLEQAAADTRIREKFLEALEAGDYQTLPGAVYTKGFLRNYAEYLDLDTETLFPLFQRERGQPEPPAVQTFTPYRRVVHGSLIFRPVVFVPVILIAFVGLFVGYMYYQFTTFAVKPRLEITDPATDLIATSADLLVRGVTVPDGHITLRVFPGPDVMSEVADGDGHFGATVSLKPGANHIEVEILDATGKTNRVTRSVQYEARVPGTAGPQLVIDEPKNGDVVTDKYIQVSGRASGSLASLSINNSAMPLNGDGRFATRYYLPAGQQTFTFTARGPNGAVTQETRTVTVVYTQAVVTVFVTGADAWIVATVDGVPVTGAAGRTYHDGETAVFSGREVRIKSGNAGATFVVYNGQQMSSLGRQGEVVERVFAQ